MKIKWPEKLNPKNFFAGRALLSIAILVLGFIALNAGYFWDNLKFTFFPPSAKFLSALPAASTTPAVFAKPDLLEIESLGIAAPVIYAEKADEKNFQAGLANGVVHYPGTALPGEKGNVYIFGHSSDFIASEGSYKRVFALLPRIRIGAAIRLSDHRGRVFVYEVKESFVAEKNRVDLLEQGGGKSMITLQTSYPVGTAWKRWIVRGELAR